jgi:GrpB-like predicted nucleotidyltransferase (UPF0157 family)
MPDAWMARAGEHRAHIMRTLPDAAIEHIGSTAIGGIRSKDVVDLLVGVPSDACSDATERLKSAGFAVEGERTGHSWLCWPNENDRKVIVHVVVADGPEWQRRVNFRDLLMGDSRLAAEYESVKAHASDQALDWDEYTSLKASFVQQVLNSRL